MNLKELLVPELTHARVDNIQSKKQALDFISRTASDADNRLKHAAILEALQQRERLGSTTIGKGVAIPHARIEDLKHILCVLMTINERITFDSDEEPEGVDIIFGLLVPETATEAHLDALAMITRRLRDEEYRLALRQATTNHELFMAATGVIDDTAKRSNH